MINVSLPADVEEFLHAAVAEGMYPSEQEVVVEAVRLLRDSQGRRQRLRAEIDEALASVDRGEGIEIESDEALAVFFDELEADVNATVAVEKKSDE
jgi:putative addiction module CopG family antidote